MDKLLSVVIPTFNRKELTDAAVASVVTSFTDLVEVVVVDDGGSDGYFYAVLNPSGVSVRTIRLDSNVGAGMARHAGVSHANGRFIAFLDSDDRYAPGWLDWVVTFLKKESEIHDHAIVIFGITEGARPVGAFTRKLLARIPQPVQLIASRIVATIFNPFYTPSSVMSIALCRFLPGLRHCEDYYSTAFALFGAKKILLPQIVACHLGRAPNSAGGESAAKDEMFKGEMKVRVAMMRNPQIPYGYKLVLLAGMGYQWIRAGIKS